MTVVLDALPDLELTGTGKSINQVYEESGRHHLHRPHPAGFGRPRQRWGMTVSITFVK